MKVSKEILKTITDELESGLLCFFNIETFEVVAIPDEDQLMDMEIEDWQDDIDKVENARDKFKEIEKMSSEESFRIMEDFVDTVDDANLKSRLIQALSGYKPFANFKLQIDQSGPYRNKWFSFRSERIDKWVIEQLDNFP